MTPTRFLFLFLLGLLPLSASSTLNDTTEVLRLYEKGKSFFPRQVDSLFYYYERGLELSESIEYHKGRVTILRSRGVVYGLIGEGENGISDLNNALQIIADYQLGPVETINSHINLGAVYDRQSNIYKALNEYIKGEEVAREHGLDDQRSMLLNNIGIAYRKLERYDEAIKIYNEALEIRKVLGDSLGMANVLMNLSTSYGFIKEGQKSKEASLKAIALYRNHGTIDDLRFAETGYGFSLILLGEYEQGVQLLSKVSTADLSGLRPAERMIIIKTLGTGYTRQKEYAKSEEVLSSIEDDIHDTNFPEFKRDYYKLRATNNNGLNDPSLAYQYLLKYSEANEDYNSAEAIKARSEMEEKFLSVQKDLAIEKQELQLDKARRERIIFLLGFIGVGLVSLLLYRLSRIRKTANQELDQKNKLIQKALSEKEILLKEIHHRVKNNLQFISSLLGLQSDHVQDRAALGALQEGQDRVQSMALIHQNLYQEDNLTGVDVHDYFQKLIQGLFDSYNIYEDRIRLKLDIQDINLDVDTVIPIGLIVNELISNSLKYAFPEGREGIITIRMHEDQDTLHLTVSDDGKGMSEAEELNLGDSFGYKLVEAFNRQLDAEMTIDRSAGTSVNIAIKNYEVVVT